jgi:16S rRNA G966 N2-methylase RsmD
MPRNNRPETPHTGRFAKATNGPEGAPPTRRAAAPAGGRFEVRIIGGEWRGRKLHFPPSAGLRPTPDRVRETVFNWLQFELAGARCLDLFAGSGALGIEALSRGAGEAVLVERDAVSARAIRDILAQLGCDRGRVEQVDALAWLEAWTASSKPFDIVFLDPPRRSVAARRPKTGSWRVARPGRGSISKTRRSGRASAAGRLDAGTQQACRRRRLSSRPPGFAGP